MSFGSSYFTLPDFNYYRPATLKEAFELLEEKEEPRLMAGGVGLIALMKERLVSASSIVDIKAIEELKGIRYEKDQIIIGSCTTLNEISEDKRIKETLHSLHQASSQAADPAIRSRATIGGNICEAIPWVDMPSVLISLGAKAEIKSKNSARIVEVEDFLKGVLEIDLKQNEILTSLIIPLTKRKSIFQKYSRGSEFSIASISISYEPGNTRVVYGSVNSKPVRCKDAEEVINSEGLNMQTIRKVSEIAYREVECMEDVLASSSYRKNIVRLLTTRALVELMQ